MKTIEVTVIITTISVVVIIALGFLIAIILFPMPVAPPPQPVQAILPTAGANLPSPAVISYPTYAYRPTFTPIPSPTSFAITPDLFRVATSAPSSSNNPHPDSSVSGSSCQAQLDYSAAIHQYNLDMLAWVYGPIFDYYDSVIEQASRDRDALRLVQAQRELANEKAEYQGRVKAENKRYSAEKAQIRATYCN